MRRRAIVRGATLLLALLMATAGVRAASAAACADADCEMPCCERDSANTTVVPVLPCCRTVAVDQAAPHPSPTTFEHDRLSLPAPSLLRASSRPAARSVASPARFAALLLPAPPLYHRHCALLL